MPTSIATDSCGATDATTDGNFESGMFTRGMRAGQRLGRYCILRSIGVGAMGHVYEAYDPLLDRAVAIKVPKPTVSEARLQREARALARIVHPNVVAVHDVGEHDGRSFIVLELVEGVTLDEWLEHPRAMQETVAVIVSAGRGLAAVHAAGLFHRDFKPENVVVGTDGRARVLDFGIAGELGSATARSRGVTGTPAYMAPEQAAGGLGSALADQFSFCVVLWEALFACRPYRRADFLRLVLGERGVPLSLGRDRCVPSWLRRLLEHGLQGAPSRRHASMSDLLDQLEAGLPELV